MRPDITVGATFSDYELLDHTGTRRRLSELHRVFSIYDGYWYWGRPSNEDLRRDLRELTWLVRPDRDITAPGMRERWEAGARDDFWPYGRSMRAVVAGLEG